MGEEEFSAMLNDVVVARSMPSMETAAYVLKIVSFFVLS